ncbi:MAG: DNA polymerase I, partial [Chloroflexi bacterium]|nr:DNA polymerase I [Chloroflexota bacterium]
MSNRATSTSVPPHPTQPHEHPLLVLIDGHALVHRAYHALGTEARTKGKQAVVLTLRRTGEPVQAVYGFALMLLKVLADLKPQYLAVTFDTPHPTFRHDAYQEYKAQRPAGPPDLPQQFGWVRKLVEAFGIPIFELPGYEADDLLGTLSRQAREQGVETVIVTGDADTMQLVSPGVRVLYPGGRTLTEAQVFDEEMVKERYGVYPNRIPDLKGLKGDPSDNIPGVPGVGDKTAVKLLDQFGSVEGVYENLALVQPARLQELLRKHEDLARKSKHLATIDTSAPFPLDLAPCRFGRFDRERVVQVLRELEFTSLLNRIPQHEAAPTGGQVSHAGEGAQQLPLGLAVSAGAGQVTTPLAARYHLVTTLEDLDALCARLVSPQGFAFDTETTSQHAMAARLVGIALALREREAYYFPVGHADGTPQLPLEEVLARLRPALENAAVPKVAHNAKYDMIVLAEHGVTVRGLAADTMIAAYLLGEKSLGLKDLAFRRLGEEMTPITDLIGRGGAKKQITMDQVPAAQAG